MGRVERNRRKVPCTHRCLGGQRKKNHRQFSVRFDDGMWVVHPCVTCRSKYATHMLVYILNRRRCRIFFGCDLLEWPLRPYWLWFDVFQSSGTAMWPTFLQRVGTTFDCGRTMQVMFGCSVFQSFLFEFLWCIENAETFENNSGLFWFFCSSFLTVGYSIWSEASSKVRTDDAPYLVSEDGGCSCGWFFVWVAVVVCCPCGCCLILYILLASVKSKELTRFPPVPFTVLVQVTKDSFTITLRWTAQMRAEKYEMQMQEPVTESIGTWVTVSSSIQSSQYVFVVWKWLVALSSTRCLIKRRGSLWKTYSRHHVFIFRCFVVFWTQRPPLLIFQVQSHRTFSSKFLPVSHPCVLPQKIQQSRLFNTGSRKRLGQ